MKVRRRKVGRQEVRNEEKDGWEEEIKGNRGRE